MERDGAGKDQKGDAKETRAREQICGKCKDVGHGNKDCKVYVFCVVCSRPSHRTEDYTVMKQPKPVAKYVGYGAKGLRCLLVQNTKEIVALEHANPMALITIHTGSLNETQLAQGFHNMFE